ncbi:10914_t:CDS:2 [Gigaspora margarita]|uniref:10914_t:CDS:1 n=1 Tax=Gigaspora margarita TaxID=4874 RepID=A0ABN7V7V5_GIGMA|nr:10914_t:CDS:2 [Gigaspora margarita]
MADTKNSPRNQSFYQGHGWGKPVGTVSVVVGLLLAFRTNHAYDRYYEGRKLFQSLCTLARNTARILWVDVDERSKRDHEDKITYIKLLLAYVIATKHHLRLEFGTNHEDFEGLLPKGYQRTKFEGNAGQENTILGSGSTEDPNHPDNIASIQNSDPEVTVHTDEANESTGLLRNQQHPVSYIKDTFRTLVGVRNSQHDVDVNWGTAEPQMSLPMEIVFHLETYFNALGREKRIELSYRLYVALDQLIDILGNLERISNTPIPAAYRIHLKQAVTLYVWVLPFTLVNMLGWFTIPVIFIVSFILFGVEAIGSEIEDPFGEIISHCQNVSDFKSKFGIFLFSPQFHDNFEIMTSSE